MTKTLYSRIYDLVRLIPDGRVSTYGRIADVADCGARQVGYALHSLPEDSGVPWHRVVGASWTISLPRGSDSHELQRILLEAEGVLFDGAGRIEEAFRFELPSSRRQPARR